MSKKYAIIVAGGSGTRMGSAIPKQFLLLNDIPVLWHSISAFANTFSDINIIVVLNKDFFTLGEDIIKKHNKSNINIKLTEGGLTRFESVKKGLAFVKEDCVVFVHDAVRCLVDETLLLNCYHCALKNTSAIPVVTSVDSIRLIENEQNKAFDRNKVMIVQTPQTFLSKTIIEAFNQPYIEAFTDEASVVEAFGNQVHLCEGNYNNIKITKPIDLIIAKAILLERKQL